eukprot:jgi/Botrbrau1/5970/Bobra.104_1s0002.1
MESISSFMASSQYTHWGEFLASNQSLGILTSLDAMLTFSLAPFCMGGVTSVAPSNGLSFT